MNSLLPYYKYDITHFTKEDWEKDVNKHFRLFTELKKNNIDFITSDFYESLIEGNYCFQIEIVNDNPYIHVGHCLVRFTLNYCSSFPIVVYMHKDLIQLHEKNCQLYSIYKPRAKIV